MLGVCSLAHNLCKLLYRDHSSPGVPHRPPATGSSAHLGTLRNLRLPNPPASGLGPALPAEQLPPFPCAHIQLPVWDLPDLRVFRHSQEKGCRAVCALRTRHQLDGLHYFGKRPRKCKFIKKMFFSSQLLRHVNVCIKAHHTYEAAH